jgi:DNA-binding response OmpR family regulator
MAAHQTTILCIDYDERALLLRTKVLERSGDRVLSATNPGDAFRLLDSEPVAAIILDYFLGSTTGAAVACELHRRGTCTPVLMLSSSVYLPDDAHGLVDAFCAKIDGPLVLFDSLQRLLDHPAASPHN